VCPTSRKIFKVGFDGDANGQALADALLAWMAALTKQ